MNGSVQVEAHEYKPVLSVETYNIHALGFPTIQRKYNITANNVH